MKELVNVKMYVLVEGVNTCLIWRIVIFPSVLDYQGDFYDDF